MSSTNGGAGSCSAAMPAGDQPRLRALHRALGIPASYRAHRHLPWQPEARRLVTVALAADDGQPVRLAPGAAAAWKRMHAAAARGGIKLLPLSGFRSVARQAEIIREKLAAGQSLNAILQLVAAPGCSEHHTGRAVDVGSAGAARLDESFARTAAFRWLKQHAGEFGFRLSYPLKNVHGIAYEPWHWCWRA
jgi:D-alanyl-D-alanine carboxypeptidase